MMQIPQARKDRDKIPEKRISRRQNNVYFAVETVVP
jgi:hypothetical protein